MSASNLRTCSLGTDELPASLDELLWMLFLCFIWALLFVLFELSIWAELFSLLFRSFSLSRSLSRSFSFRSWVASIASWKSWNELWIVESFRFCTNKLGKLANQLTLSFRNFYLNSSLSLSSLKKKPVGWKMRKKMTMKKTTTIKVKTHFWKVRWGPQ